MSIDIERLKVDPDYWDEAVSELAVAAQDMGKGQHPCFYTQQGVEIFLETGSESQLIYRPEPSTDVARSIEAARVAEQSDRTYPHYFKDVSGVDAIDLYHVARLYDITDPALFHAFKKIACAGKRGAKDQAQDVQEAIDALKRWQELNK